MNAKMSLLVIPLLHAITPLEVMLALLALKTTVVMEKLVVLQFAILVAKMEEFVLNPEPAFALMVLAVMFAMKQLLPDLSSP